MNAEEFWACTERNGECLDWKGGGSGGYGHVKWKGKNVKAHRLAFFLTHGRWPKGVLRHRCDRPCCVEPGHLLEGTQAQNVQDAIERGRHQRGVRNGKAKLDPEKIEEGKRLHSEGWSFAKIGRLFGVQRAAARKAVLGINWRASS